jgi:hypothetical protein
LVEQEVPINAAKSLVTGAVLLASVAPALTEEPKDYVGPFPTQMLYDLCSNPVSREKCNLYIQGLLNGIRTQRSMHEHGLPVCLPEMTTETARLNILKFIDGVTGGRPSNNKDGGDWMAFLGVAAGNTCKK